MGLFESTSGDRHLSPLAAEQFRFTAERSQSPLYIDNSRASTGMDRKDMSVVMNTYLDAVFASL